MCVYSIVCLCSQQYVRFCQWKNLEFNQSVCFCCLLIWVFAYTHVVSSWEWIILLCIVLLVVVVLERSMVAGKLTLEGCERHCWLYTWPLQLYLTVFRYAMKCLNKKRLKLRKGESGAVNESNMLALVCLLITVVVFSFVSVWCVQVNNPFIVCMTYAFQTPGNLCLVLDLMNGKELSCNCQ